MAKYFLTNKAVDDLSEIWNYTYEIWSENQADKYYHELLSDCRELAENQTFGKNYDEITTTIFGYQSGQHLIFYRILNVSEIEIIRILHARMDLKNKIQR